ncbi:gamma-gliadin [Eurytemora carolleeae]|uniref:gamma-gliadin n=1 Tax=Eurytemora carolleeae TaxID=1294199 RepID=UPI000C75F32E|nr:gamma-gliadin [Eurytemora carolleeae]|eukprot:XP_023322952.1 gamma-gliadin-like [Eurytemora affinis]
MANSYQGPGPYSGGMPSMPRFPPSFTPRGQHPPPNTNQMPRQAVYSGQMNQSQPGHQAPLYHVNAHPSMQMLYHHHPHMQVPVYYQTNGGRHQAPIQQQQQYPQQPGYPYPPVSMQQTNQPPQSVYQYPSNMQVPGVAPVRYPGHMMPQQVGFYNTQTLDCHDKYYNL